MDNHLNHPNVDVNPTEIQGCKIHTKIRIMTRGGDTFTQRIDPTGVRGITPQNLAERVNKNELTPMGIDNGLPLYFWEA